jgi:predicted TIM-barrel fold metal-dependent hydrolase
MNNNHNTWKNRKYNGIRGLAELPYFELTEHGLLRLTIDELQGGIDAHVHFALNAHHGPKPDLLKQHPKTKYYVNTDGVISLNNYIAANQTPEDVSNMLVSILDSFTPAGSPWTESHTIPNLIAEIDLLNIEKAVVFPIAYGFPYGDDMSEWYLDSIERSGHKDRFIVCGSVKPTLPDAVERTRQLKAKGVRGIKLHPNFGFFTTDDRLAWPFYEECCRLNLPVLVHCGLIGRENPDLEKAVGYTGLHADIKYFPEPIDAFPNLRFVLCHAGSIQFIRAVELAKKHHNVWLDIQGQSVDNIIIMFSECGPERIFFGSDYPIYPVSYTLARLLIATEKDSTIRRMLFSENASRFWDT